MKRSIHILWATIRPSLFLSSFRTWMDKSNDNSNITISVAVNSEEHKSIIENFLINNYPNINHNIIITITDKIGVCYSSYCLSKSLDKDDINDNDIVILASDDFLPPIGWDKYLLDKFNSIESELISLFVNDGYQLKDSSNMIAPCVTIPILNIKLLKELNHIIYHPSYTHMFSDNEFYLNCQELGALVNCYDDGIVFKHYHHSTGNRRVDNYDVEYHKKWNEDKLNWEKRKKINIKERII